MQQHWTIVTEKMHAAGYGLTPAEWRRGRAQNVIYWATIAYDTQDFVGARNLVSEARRQDPLAVLRDRLGRIRSLAALVTLLPSPLHASLQRWFNTRV